MIGHLPIYCSDEQVYYINNFFILQVLLPLAGQSMEDPTSKWFTLQDRVSYLNPAVTPLVASRGTSEFRKKDIKHLGHNRK